LAQLKNGECPALGRWRQEDLEFEANLGYIVWTLSQKTNKQEKGMVKCSALPALRDRKLYIHGR
jgi:hypothetical protein